MNRFLSLSLTILSFFLPITHPIDIAPKRANPAAIYMRKDGIRNEVDDVDEGDNDGDDVCNFTIIFIYLMMNK